MSQSLHFKVAFFLVVSLFFGGCAGLPRTENVTDLSTAPPKRVYVQSKGFGSKNEIPAEALLQEVRTSLAEQYELVEAADQADVRVNVIAMYYGDKRTEAAKGGGLDKGTEVLTGATTAASVGGGILSATKSLAGLNPVSGAALYLGGKLAEAVVNGAAQSDGMKHYYIKYLLGLEDGSLRWSSFLAHEYAQPQLTQEQALTPLAKISAATVRTLMQRPMDDPQKTSQQEARLITEDL